MRISTALKLLACNNSTALTIIKTAAARGYGERFGTNSCFAWGDPFRINRQEQLLHQAITRAVSTAWLYFTTLPGGMIFIPVPDRVGMIRRQYFWYGRARFRPPVLRCAAFQRACWEVDLRCPFGAGLSSPAESSASSSPSLTDWASRLESCAFMNAYIRRQLSMKSPALFLDFM